MRQIYYAASDAAAFERQRTDLSEAFVDQRNPAVHRQQLSSATADMAMTSMCGDYRTDEHGLQRA